MSFWASLAAALPAIGNAGSNLLGSLISHHDNKADRRESSYQFQQQMDYSIQRRVADGLKAGINPLAAIGASVNYSPTVHSGGGSDTGSFVSRAGEHLSRLFERKALDDLEYEREARNLDLEGKRLENRILRNHAQESENNLNSDSGLSKTGSGKIVADVQPNRLGDKPLFYPVYDLQGRPRLVVNQDVVEGDSDNAGYIASLKHAISQGFVDKVTGEVKSDQYKMMLDDMYYNMTGRHIANLDKLYVSPAEAGIGILEFLGQIFPKWSRD